MKRFVLLILAVIPLLVSCRGEEPFSPKSVNYDNVAIIMSLGRNSLARYLTEDIADLCNTKDGAYLPGQKDNKALVIVAHTAQKNSSGSYDYSILSDICVIHLYAKSDGTAVRDTIKRFDCNKVLTDPGTMREVLSYVTGNFKSEHYGLLYSSHAGGWLPVKYTGSSNSMFSVGHEMQGSVKSETDIREFASGLPMHLDYLLFDACLMGNIESAYELKDCADLLAVSPTEILGEGFLYKKLSERLLASAKPDIKGVCEDYMSQYAEGGGGATITLLETSKLSALKDVCKKVYDKYRSEIAEANPYQIQRYYTRYQWFFDMMHVLEVSGVDKASLDEVQSALNDCIIYTDHTKKFLSIPIDHYCGLGMFAPFSDPDVHDYYRTLSWNIDTQLLK